MIKILIVEDEPGIYTFLQEGLTDEGYDTGVIDVFMNALRRKLHLKTDGCIKTIRGVGFIATDR